jgi:phosphatidylglycerol:prolipoprotein diacylglycerol transferase
MRQTLFHIPIHIEVLGMPLFGFGLLLAVWAIVSALILALLIRRHGFGQETQSYLPVLGMFGLVIYFLPGLADSQGLPVRGFGVMLLSALVAGLWLAVRRARQVGVDPETIVSLAFWMFITGIVGARLFYVIQKWEEFQHETTKETLVSLLNVTQGGLVVYGSVIAAGATMFLFCRHYRLPTLAVSDLIAPSLLVGLALGRVGCFFNGCCFGGVCELPWAVTFPWRSPPHVRQAQTGQIDLHGLYLYGPEDGPPVIQGVVPGSAAALAGLKAGDRIERINRVPVRTLGEAVLRPIKPSLLTVSEELEITVAGDPQPKRWKLASPLPRSLPVHPTQLYSTLDGLILALFLWAWYPFRRRDGEVTAWMITLYPITRFLMESIRTDEPKNILGMTISQNISLVLLLVGIGLWCHLWRQAPRVHFGGALAGA